MLNINVAITPTTVKSPTTTLRPTRRPKHARDINSDWKDEPFKTTDTIQYVGFDKKISDIRGCLNKLSNKNYDTIRETIYENINVILNGEEGVSLSDDNMTQIVNCIFDIASNNGFYAELYAQLYKNLIEEYVFFEKTADTSITGYIQSVSNIRYEDSDGNYDLHCIINKENDSRKSLLTFVIMLIRNEVLPITTVGQLIDHLDGLISSNIDNKARVFINNELIENYSILLATMIPNIFALENWPSIYEGLLKYTKYTTKTQPGLSSRAKFKLMDIKDMVSKKMSA
jgi:hypothetical protein